MPHDYRDRHVVVTGGDGALGRGVVAALVEAGAECHLPVVGKPSGPAQPKVHLSGPIDLTQEAAVAQYYAGLPPIAASIHLAGGFHAAAIVDTDVTDLRGQFDLNLVTAFLCCREAVRVMRKAGSGRIVNVAARIVEVPVGGMAAYSVAKAGVAALTRALAEEVRADSILVNAVLPSIIDTPANRAAMPKAPHDRWPKPAEIAAAILWLASSANQLTSGALVPVYGKA
ncbi:MAG: SDR family NAD(P)-dependent oxidoreductase [Gemmatimonadales bacterium]